jgi:hypothetical protein
MTRDARLWLLIGVAGAYGAWQRLLPAPTLGNTADAVAGVLLGLYICSKPAANGIDLIFAGRGTLRRSLSAWPGIRWLALNFLVMCAGWLVLVGGVARLVGGVE